MRKYILFVVATIVAMTSISDLAMAQWLAPTYYEADELKGESAYYANVYRDKSGSFVCWSNETNVKINSYSGIFDYHDSYVYVLVGFYEGDKLVEKVTTKFYVPNGDSDTAYSSDYQAPKDLGAKIILHLKTKGKVRIIAPKYSGPDFDLSIPMNASIKTEIKETSVSEASK